MSKKLFVGGLSWDTNDESLKSAFEAHGKVLSAKVVTDRETGKSRGFGFVEYESDNDAREAVDAMDGRELDGRTIRVDEAKERERSNRPNNDRKGSRHGGGKRSHRDRY